MLLSDLINVPITPQRLSSNVLVLVVDLSKVRCTVGGFHAVVCACVLLPLRLAA
jgi:hypothetical protein